MSLLYSTPVTIYHLSVQLVSLNNMFRQKQSFILFLIYFTSCDCGYARFSREYDAGHGNDFEMLKLAQTWSPTTCIDFRNKHHYPKDACTSCSSPKAINKWTIHGLWPSNRNNDGPFECSANKYRASLVDQLRKELNTKWPSTVYDNDSFWSHEWKKHGTCSNLKATDTVPKYFATSLQLFNNYNLGNILEVANIVPGNNYALDYLYKVIKEKLGVNAFVQCIRIQGKKEQYLSQVQLCFNKSLQLIDCDRDNGYLSSCKRYYDVTYAKSC